MNESEQIQSSHPSSNKKNNTSLIFNVVLTIAVVVLFILQFTSKPSKSGPTSSGSTSSGEGLNIVYFNADSLLANYKMYDTEREELKKKSQEYENRLAGDQRTFEKEAREFQQRAEFLTITDREARQEKLMRKQQELMQLQEKLSGQLMRDEAEMTERIFDTIEAYLKEYVADRNIHYILSYSRGGGIWYANSENDITDDLIAELNKRYEKAKK
ncbi:MAG: OmpH family outer membrane protein [Flavobacteriales bacterium]